jgi:hypothetical protein
VSNVSKVDDDCKEPCLEYVGEGSECCFMVIGDAGVSDLMAGSWIRFVQDQRVISRYQRYIEMQKGA